MPGETLRAHAILVGAVSLLAALLIQPQGGTAQEKPASVAMLFGSGFKRSAKLADELLAAEAAFKAKDWQKLVKSQQTILDSDANPLVLLCDILIGNSRRPPRSATGRFWRKTSS
jgi:hypothetical protein